MRCGRKNIAADNVIKSTPCRTMNLALYDRQTVQARPIVAGKELEHGLDGLLGTTISQVDDVNENGIIKSPSL
jgi:hypothetical protein